jgi:LDH2 family malate/lactate/ureidoglycolate dehydrogenase
LPVEQEANDRIVKDVKLSRGRRLALCRKLCHRRVVPVPQDIRSMDRDRGRRRTTGHFLYETAWDAGGTDCIRSLHILCIQTRQPFCNPISGPRKEYLMNETTTLSIIELHQRVEAIFRKAGLSEVQAGAVTRVIVAGERDACKSHGIYRIEGALRTVKAGKVKPQATPKLVLQEASSIVRVDAGGGFANAAFELGVPVLADRARSHGIAALVINDCTHFSALWPEVEALTAQGLAGLVMCPSYAAVAPAGGNSPLLGTNPFAFGWPRRNDRPYVFDFATSVAARGEIELHRRAGKQLPEGWAIASDGQPTTDPQTALAGAMLPFGGHKGSAIGTMIELLAGIMIGDLTSPEVLDLLGTTTLSPSHGELIIAFSPEAFAKGRPGDPFARAEILFDAIVGQGARLPSQRRFAARSTSEKTGIVLTQDEIALLARLLAEGLDAIT